MKNYEFKLSCDLDGVLADFQGKIAELAGMPFERVSRGYRWALVQKYNDEVGPFFESLKKMPDADKLWRFANDNFGHVFILTASGNTPKAAADQKRAWVKKQFGAQVVVKVVVAASEKAKFATPRTILVDDSPKALGPWVAAGGIAVPHTSVADSIKQLQEILNASK